MAVPRAERRLAAILAADVAGYSRLMGRDEDGTLARLKAHRKELIEPLLAEHHGRIVKLMGDGALCEFASVVDAVACAVAIQRGMVERERDVPEAERLRFRIGINLGDVIVEGEDLYGDGVNVAARLEGLAEPGGICISRTVRDHVRDKLPFTFDDLGEHRVKNIARPLRVFRVLAGPEAASQAVRKRKAILPWRSAALLATILIPALAAGVAGWLRPWESSLETAADADLTPPLPDKPSLAVLPFANLSGDAEQDYFAEGLTDDLITDLSKISGLFVIARSSVFAYEGEPVDAPRMAEELGVRYVLEGSVRRAGDRVRINAQLIDGATGNHLWAERYDRDYADIFALQDEVIGRIVEALSVELTETEEIQVARPPTDNLEAYDYYLRAEQKVYNAEYTSLNDALVLYEKAIALDPEFADAYAGYARAAVDVLSFTYTHLLPSAVAREQAYEAAGRALALNPATPRAYSVLALLQMLDGEHDEAIESARRAVALDANSADAHLNLAVVLTYAGRPAEALSAMETLLRLNPKPPPYVHGYHGFVLYMNRQYGEAIEALEKIGDATHSDFGLETLAMAYARLGRMVEARAAVEALLERWPNYSLAFVRVAYAHHRRGEDLSHRLDALRDAGFPEWPRGFTGSPEDRLDGDAIRALTFGRTWFGKTAEGQPFVQQVDANGDAVQRRPSGLIVGTVSLDGDLLCKRSPAILMGRRYCGPVYRNPGGTFEGKDEYTHPSIDTVRYFSIMP